MEALQAPGGELVIFPLFFIREFLGDQSRREPIPRDQLFGVPVSMTLFIDPTVSANLPRFRGLAWGKLESGSNSYMTEQIQLLLPSDDFIGPPITLRQTVHAGTSTLAAGTRISIEFLSLEIVPEPRPSALLLIALAAMAKCRVNHDRASGATIASASPCLMR
jgi:hypothetical protein